MKVVKAFVETGCSLDLSFGASPGSRLGPRIPESR